MGLGTDRPPYMGTQKRLQVNRTSRRITSQFLHIHMLISAIDIKKELEGEII